MRWNARFPVKTQQGTEKTSVIVHADSIHDAMIYLRRNFQVAGEVDFELLHYDPRCDHYWLYRRGGKCQFCGEEFQRPR